MKLNTKRQRVPTRFDRQIRFELEPKLGFPGAAQAQNTFEQLKARLLKPVLNEALEPGLKRRLRLAANEAAAVAWTTPFPLLVLPGLLEEKTAEVYEYTSRQAVVQRGSPVLFDAGAAS